jgi:hypothetical protein
VSKNRSQFPQIPVPIVDDMSSLNPTKLVLLIDSIAQTLYSMKLALDMIAAQFYNGSSAPPTMYMQSNAPDTSKCYNGDLWFDTTNSFLNVLYDSNWVQVKVDLTDIQSQINALKPSGGGGNGL